MAFAEVNGISMYYEVHGEGIPVVFAHGSGGNHISWWQQIPYFSKFYKCIIFDHRTFGRTPDEPEPKGRTAFADDLKGLLDYLEIDKVAIVAHSMGGRTAAVFSLRNPERVTALVFSGTNGGSDNEESRAVRRKHKAAPPFLPEGAIKALSSDFSEKFPEKSLLYRQIMRMNPRHSPDFLAPRPNHNGSTDGKFSELGIPILFMVGEEDKLVHPKTIEIASSLISHSHFVMVEEAGHSVYYERPEFFNELVHNFLKTNIPA
ncbi:alpha/beta hydrolase [Chloroflexi bacterium]|nr:alpha/beta hydrolase [Chloroflexota bacterium]